MKKQLYIFIILILFSCNDYNNAPSKEELMIDSLKVELRAKDNSIKSLEDNIQIVIHSLINMLYTLTRLSLILSK